ncbi:Olfactory receptor 14A16 [Manis javanica]|nr:Olfactory receptor 14A16 [Manis javanica]
MIPAPDRRLRTPMYFLLKNLSFVDLCLISATAPKSIANSLTHSNSISVLECVSQVFLVAFSGTTELHLLTVTCFDRYAAICRPLHYENMCVQLAAVSWLGGSLIAVMHTVGTFSLSYCGSNVVHHFSCDIPQLLAISCSENLIDKIINDLQRGLIFPTVMKVASPQGEQRAFSTCGSHVPMVVSLCGTATTVRFSPSWSRTRQPSRTQR